MICMFDLKYDLILTLVKRWRLDTNTFHLLCGECIITLEDVALQLELSIVSSTVTGVSTVSEPMALCYDLLGRSPDDCGNKFKSLRFSRLKTNFKYLSSTTTEKQVNCAVRAYIMHMIEGVLMLDANNNKAHLLYLPLLSYLYAVRSYNWGSIVLATLYHELCQRKKCHAMDIDRCLVLLQSWALYQIHSWHQLLTKHVFPLVNL